MRAIVVRIGLSFALCFSALPAFAADDGNARLDKVVPFYLDNKQFMGSVLVARGDKILLDKGYGRADVEKNIANAPDTKFRLGSVTKQFTAAAILLLEERGKLKTDDPVRKYLPDAPAAWDKVTIFHLLTHTSGIPNFTEFPDYRDSESKPVTPAQLVARFRDKPLDFQPGEQWKYSNSGYVLLGYIIEKVSGRTYQDFLQANIFTPLELSDTGYDHSAFDIPRHAVGYVRQGQGFEKAGYIDMSIPFSAGALYSTTHDLLRWEQALFGGKLLSADSLRKMTTPFKSDYAFGLGVTTRDGHTLISHGGGIEGFNTELDYYPDDKLTVIVLGNVNGGAPYSIARDLGAVAEGETVTLASERKEVKIDPNLLDRYVGHYALTPALTFAVTKADGHLVTQLTGQPPVDLFAESERDFFAKAVDAQITFVVPKQGAATSLILHQNGSDQVADRIDEAQAKSAADHLAQRIKDNRPAPDSEAALRRQIGIFQQGGQPDYDHMSDGLAKATREQLPKIEATLKGYGALRSVAFDKVAPNGADIYDVTFANARTVWSIAMGAGGKIEGLFFKPAP
jgi:CubicO group peptidase (beta-lactamase class C family)